jgi:hypothetical protein
VQDMCTVCAKRTIGSKIALDPPNGSPRFEAQLEACFGPLEIVLILMQDRCTVCAEHTIGLQIVLDALDGTPT